MARFFGGLGLGLKYAFLITYLAVVVFPMVWVFYTSAKDTREIYAHPFGVPKVVYHPNRETAKPLIQNYTKAFVDSHFAQFIWNSVYVVTVSLLFIVGLSAM